MTSRERVKRDNAIVVDVDRRMKYAVVATTVRTVERAVAGHRADAPAPEPFNRFDMAAEIRDGFDQAISGLAELSVDGKQEHVRLGAIKQRVEVTIRKLELLRALRVLPHLGQWAVLADAAQIIREFGEIAARYDLPEEYPDELAALADKADPTTTEGRRAGAA